MARLRPPRKQPRKARIKSKPLGREIRTFFPERSRAYKFLAIVSTLTDHEFIQTLRFVLSAECPFRRPRDNSESNNVGWKSSARVGPSPQRPGDTITPAQGAYPS